jgi:hypothetical protein
MFQSKAVKTKNGDKIPINLKIFYVILVTFWTK